MRWIDTIDFIVIMITMVSYFKNYRIKTFSFSYAAEGIGSLNHYRGFIFAADEKTEDPTPKKIKDARKKGQVAKSSDLNSAIILVIMALLTLVSGDTAFKNLYLFLYRSLSNINIDVANTDVRALGMYYGYYFFSITAIVFVTVMIGGIIANVTQSGFLFTLDPLKPNFKKLNPIEGFKNQFSKKSAFNMFKTLMKLVLVGYVAYGFIKANIFNIFRLTDVSVSQIYPYMKDLLVNLILRIAIFLMILGIVDLVFQKYDHKKNLRMTKHEIKEEMKQMEGDPQVKSFRRQKQRQLAMARMMEDVPKASVVITNPTHIAVAIKYEDGKDEAPKVMAMGADHVAFKIREIAKEHDIPIMENKPLARLLFKQAKVGKDIPVELYKSVAEILAAIYRMKQKKNYLR
ncbi:MAG: flagellar biosynthesis protein FlhB [Clostridiales bacterium]|nr:flagellar biosynthesis protein FlhB [Clostridiales bacterium]